MGVSTNTLSEALLRLYAPAAMPDFSRNVMDCLKLVFPDQQFSVDEIFFDSGEVLHHGHDGYALDTPGIWQAWALYAHQNPLVRDLADRKAPPIICLSDVMNRRELTRLDLYHTAYRHIDILDQVAICLARPHSTLGITVNSPKTCTAAQRAAAELLYPHMVQAQRQAALGTPLGFDALPFGRHHLELPLRGTHGRADDYPREARLLLDRFFGPSRAKPWQPPADLLAWIAQRREFFREGGHSWRRFQPLVLQRAGDELHVNLAQRPDDAGDILTLIAQLARPLKPADAASLTPREKQIAHWVAQGKTNGEIGIILGISPLTVKTHVERILAKLGVENRTALVAQRR